MLDRDSKKIAVQMSISLPDDKETALRVCQHLNDLVNNWLYEESANHYLEDKNLDSSSAVARFSGKAAVSPL